MPKRCPTGLINRPDALLASRRFCRKPGSISLPVIGASHTRGRWFWEVQLSTSLRDSLAFSTRSSSAPLSPTRLSRIVAEFVSLHSAAVEVCGQVSDAYADGCFQGKELLTLVGGTLVLTRRRAVVV